MIKSEELNQFGQLDSNKWECFGEVYEYRVENFGELFLKVDSQRGVIVQKPNSQYGLNAATQLGAVMGDRFDLVGARFFAQVVD